MKPLREPGIYKDIHIDDYHSEEGISSTGMREILDCAAKYIYLKKNPTKVTDEMIIGRLFHALMLEPENIDRDFYINSRKFGTSKVDREAKKKILEQCDKDRKTFIDKKLYQITYDMYQEAIKDNLWKDPVFNLQNGNREYSIYLDMTLPDRDDFKEYKVRVRSRPDFFNDKIIIEIKTAASLRRFDRDVFEKKYHVQAALQLDSLFLIDEKNRDFHFFVIEKKPPYLMQWRHLTEDDIKLGRAEYRKAAVTYQKCLETNKWPGYEKNSSAIKKPFYYGIGDEDYDF